MSGGVGVWALLLRGVSSPGGVDSVSMWDSSSETDLDAGGGGPLLPSTACLDAWFAGDTIK